MQLYSQGDTLLRYQKSTKANNKQAISATKGK